MLTQKDYCDYDTCVALKEVGCPMIKEGYLGLSLYSAQKWLRDEKRIHIVLTYYTQLAWYEYSVKEDDNLIAEGSAFPTYEEALSTAIYMAVEYLKEDK